MFNTHFDHIGVEAREQSALLIRERIAEIARDGEPFLLMGDFNEEPGSKPIEALTGRFDDARDKAQTTFGPTATFSGFYVAEPMTRRIDYIFTSPGDWVVLKHAVLTDSKDLRYYSDHLPVVVEVIPAPDRAGDQH